MEAKKRHVYDYDVDLMGQNAPVHVMHLVGRSKRVLEVGCGPGSVTRLLVQGNCRVTGLEVDSEAIKRATPYCEKIIHADLNSETWPHMLEEEQRFDVVVAADVLEHLYNPWMTLKHMTALIGPDGYLVVSLPHAGHAAILSCLLNSDFEYRDFGLLDRTHIRFFGLRNMEDLFGQAGLKIIEAKYVLMRPEDTELCSHWSGLSPKLKNALRMSPSANIYQVVVKAVPLSYSGERVPLTPPPQQKFDLRVLDRSTPWRTKFARFLSPQQKQHIRKGLRFFGIHL